MARLTDDQLNALTEIMNIGMGRAAATLNEMLESHIELDVPSISLYTPEDLKNGDIDRFRQYQSWIKLDFQGEISGVAGLVFNPEDAIKLVVALVDEEIDSPVLDGIMAETLNEVGNIVINGIIGSISNILEKHFDFSLPLYVEGNLTDLCRQSDFAPGRTIILVHTYFKVQDLQIDGYIFLIFEEGSFHNLLSSIDSLTGIPQS